MNQTKALLLLKSTAVVQKTAGVCVSVCSGGGVSDRPVSAASLQAEAQVVHSIQVLTWQGVIPQLPEVLGPQVLASISRHGVVTLEEQ